MSSAETYALMCLLSISKFPPSLCAPTLPTALSEELNAAALVPMDALLLQLLPLRPFAEVVLQQDLREFEACPQLALFPRYWGRVDRCFAVSLCNREIVIHLSVISCIPILFPMLILLSVQYVLYNVVHYIGSVIQ